MKLQLFTAHSRMDLQSNHVHRTTLSMKLFDVNCMWQGYYAEKPGLRSSFHAFCRRWENEWYPLLCPQAGIVRWSKEELYREYISAFAEKDVRRRLEKQCSSGYASVWTIGDALERAAIEEARSSALQAMFLDVACSLYLGVIRNGLREYVTYELHCEQGTAVLAEHSPCIDAVNENSAVDMRLVHIVKPWLSAKEDNRPSVTLNNHKAMLPLKTQCNMLFIGTSQEGRPIHLNTIPCSNCTGNRCLYSQFGGCHLPPKYQPWIQE